MSAYMYESGTHVKIDVSFGKRNEPLNLSVLATIGSHARASASTRIRLGIVAR